MVFSDDERDEGELQAIPRAAAAPALFSQDDEILLLEEYTSFAKTPESHTKHKWVEFRKMSKLSEKYNPRQIAKKIERLRRKFEKSKIGASPPHDTHQARLLQLSNSLWAIPEETTVDGRKRFLDDKPSSESEDVVKRQRREEEFAVKQLELFCQAMLIEEQLCEIALKKLKRHTLPSSSSPKEKKIEEKGSCRGTNLNSDIEFFNDNLVTQESDSPSNKKQSSRKKKPSNKKQSSRKKKDPKGKRVDVQTRASDVVIEELAMGDPNGKLAALGMKVKVRFIGKLKDSGQVFESTGKAVYKISLGYEEMIDGFLIGVDGMRVGGKRRLTIPPSLGFGEDGFDDVVPPNSWLVYEIEMVDVLN